MSGFTRGQKVRYRWDVACKSPEDRRGEYSEIVTVETATKSRAAAIRAAQEVLDKDYVEGMRAVRAELIPEGFITY